MDERKLIMMQGIGGALLGISVMLTNKIVRRHEERLNMLMFDMRTVEMQVQQLEQQ